jgi:hypothetical protein
MPSGRYELDEDDDVSSEVRREKTLLNMLNLNCKREKENFVTMKQGIGTSMYSLIFACSNASEFRCTYSYLIGALVSLVSTDPHVSRTGICRTFC